MLDTALEAADWKGFKKRRKAAKREGKLRGIGLALFLEPSGGMGKEQVELRVEHGRRLAMYSLAGPSGQGHETVFPALVADVLGLPEDEIDLRYNDRAAPKLARHRHLRLALADQPRRARCWLARRRSSRRAEKLAARELEVAPADVTSTTGEYRVAGTDLSMSACRR